jgi:ABC-type antimicrobial peptide transport system permease subunit
MVNEAFVHRFFPSSSPIGHHFEAGGDYEIVGVVRDALFHNARDQMIPFAFTAMLQQQNQMILTCELEIRARGDAHALAPAVRRVVSETDARLKVTRTQTLRDQVLATFQPDRVAAGFVAVFAGLALLLAAIGLYGVVSHSVGRRTQEIGVRLALGATRRDVIWLITRETINGLAIGVTLGAGAAVLSGRAVASQLFGVSTSDVSSLAAAIGALVFVAVIASLVPAGRALRIEPTTALRTE